MRIALEPRGAFGHKLEDRRRLPVRAGSRPARPSPSTNKQLIEARGSRAEARCPVGGSVASGEWVRRQPPTADRHYESTRPRGGVTAPLGDALKASLVCRPAACYTSPPLWEASSSRPKRPSRVRITVRRRAPRALVYPK